MHLKDPSLLRSDAFIDGAWCRADDGATARLDLDEPITFEQDERFTHRRA